MKTLTAHLRTLTIWLISGGWHRWFLFLSSIPILWLYWGFCCPALIAGKIDLKNTFLALFVAGYALAFLQDFTNNDTSWGLSKGSSLPACPALPISPLKRVGAEFIFFCIVTTLIFIPFFVVRIIMGIGAGQEDLALGLILQNAIQGTLAIAPIIFCIRLNVNGIFILPATVRTTLLVVLCAAFILFQASGFYSHLWSSAALFIIQIVLISTLFIWLRGPNQPMLNQRWGKYFSRNILDDIVLSSLWGNVRYRNARPPKLQVVLDLSRFIGLYLLYWGFIYLPILGILYYFLIHFLNKAMLLWFLFFLLLLLPTQDAHGLKERFFLPALALPLRREAILRRFYLLFTLGIGLIWTAAMALATLMDKQGWFWLLPMVLIFAPTVAGIWINQMTKKRILVFTGMVLLSMLPIGHYLDFTQKHPILMFFFALLGAGLPYKCLIPPEEHYKQFQVSTFNQRI